MASRVNLECNGLSVLVKNVKFFSFLAEYRRADGRTIRYQYPCFNDFGYRIVGKYRYFLYIVYRYTSLHLSLCNFEVCLPKVAEQFCNITNLNWQWTQCLGRWNHNTGALLEKYKLQILMISTSLSLLALWLGRCSLWLLFLSFFLFLCFFLLFLLFCFCCSWAVDCSSSPCSAAILDWTKKKTKSTNDLSVHVNFSSYNWN